MEENPDDFWGNLGNGLKNGLQEIGSNLSQLNDDINGSNDWVTDSQPYKQLTSTIQDVAGGIHFKAKQFDELIGSPGAKTAELLEDPTNKSIVSGLMLASGVPMAPGLVAEELVADLAPQVLPEAAVLPATLAVDALIPGPPNIKAGAKALDAADAFYKTTRPLKKGTPPPPGTPLPGAQPPQVAFAGNAGRVGTTVPQPQLNDHVWRLSNHDPEFLEHGRARQGMAEDFPDHFKKLNKDFDGYKRWSREWTSRISQMPPVHGAKDPTAYFPRIRLYRDRVNGVVNKKQFQRVDPELISQDLKRMMDQHHLFPVADSAAFVGKMMDMIRAGKADNDDLLNMFIYADYMGATMGNSWRNMLNMSQKPHDALHAMYQTRGQKLFGTLDDVKSSNDLHRKLKEYIVERAIPSKKEAIKLQKAHFDTLSFPQKEEYLHELMEFKMTFEKQLSAKQKSAYEEYIEALRARGSQ